MEKNLNFLVEKFIAHMGFHNDKAPENTLAAFSNAIENGYTIELDLRAIEDDIAVFHDEKLGRLTGQDGYISKLKAADLKNYKILGTEEHIPTLKEVLELVKGQTPIILDIKTDSASVGKFEKQIYKEIKDYKGQIAIMSFNPFTVEWFKKNAPEIVRGLLSTKWSKKLNLPDRPNSFIKRFVTAHNLFRKRADPDFAAFNIDNLPSIQARKFKNKTLLGWIVKSQQQYLEKVKLVDNIIFENFKPKI